LSHRGPHPRTVWRRLVGSPWTWLAVVVVGGSGVSLLTGENSLPVYWRLGREQRRLEEEVGRLRQQEQALARQVEAIQHDPFLLEKIAREQYNLRRPDEQVLEIVEPVPVDGERGIGPTSGETRPPTSLPPPDAAP